MTNHSSSPSAAAEALIAQLRKKLRNLATEFANGDINREQFQTLYERYQSQINLAALAADELAARPVGNTDETIAIRRNLEGKALAMAVYHYRSQRFIEQVGNFEVPYAAIRDILHDIAERAAVDEPLEPQTHPYGERYLLFVAGKYTVSIMVFSHEPVVRQIATVQNMHADFEVANAAVLQRAQVTGDLAVPFFALVMRSLRKRM
ncbi:MAG: hypothetical protein CUN49_11985 [Candidatus Thermofonsia Clade 1 bacterium]|uniref:Uncharacterized protein n=1 Tax=Candidatus Thermofonsia Clade 1 bacterium TaxID=2364210 RepID=A0A2M8PC89_9CHLR|nr:MAG: hypothetical protein CUN49_11985 [Candidatus Thermofonsia Clade 1 bacterium]